MKAKHGWSRHPVLKGVRFLDEMTAAAATMTGRTDGKCAIFGNRENTV